MKKVLILESDSDQAKTFNFLLKNNDKFKIYNYKGNKVENKHYYDIIIPTGANSTFDYINNFDNCRIGQINYTKNNIITFDKIKFLNIVKNIGVPIPQTFTNKKDLSFFPIFYKSLREEGYSERGILRSHKDAKKLDNKNIFFQEFIWSKGTYSVGFLADRGKLITYFTQKEILSYPYHGGSGVVLEHIENKNLLNYTKKIIEETNYSGWGLTEFKYSNRIEDFVFMEVNAKFWASIKFAFFNNPLFLKLLFDINKPKKNVKKILYLDRLILSELSEIKVAFPYLFKSKLTYSKPILRAFWDRITGNRTRAERVKLMR